MSAHLLGLVLVAQAGVFRGPMLNDITSDAVTVIWESVAPSTGVIRYGVVSPNENTLTDATPGTHYAVRINGLSALGPPGTEITYELEVDGTIYPGRFFMPVAGASPFSFIVYGDNRSSPAQHQAVVDALLAEQVLPRLGRIGSWCVVSVLPRLRRIGSWYGVSALPTPGFALRAPAWPSAPFGRCALALTHAS